MDARLKAVFYMPESNGVISGAAEKCARRQTRLHFSWNIWENLMKDERGDVYVLMFEIKIIAVGG